MTETVALIHPESLAATLNAVNEVLFFQRELPAGERRAVTSWISDRQGLPGAYAGMFAPTDADYTFGITTFTGEPVRSGAATGHILSEEACRALYLLGVEASEARASLERARRGIFKRLADTEAGGDSSGVYCCGTCSVALWRHLSVSNQPSDLRRLEHGLSELRRHRDGQGRWRRFPFYYTLLTLADIHLPAIRDELRYAEPVMDRNLRRLSKQAAGPAAEPQMNLRRQVVLERALEQC